MADVVIDAAGEDSNAGTVHITFGSSTGVTSNVRTLQQGFSSVAGTREASDFFGTGIAIGNFNGSGAAEIAISAPSENFGNISVAGMVNIDPPAYGTPLKKGGTPTQSWFESPPCKGELGGFLD